ncbi:MAG: glycosyl transferase [Acidobacteria bacterium]|nr:MAG: glycosyl transferase [Acidobacteriota bacterium]
MRILFVTNMYPSAERPAWGTFVWQQAQQLRQFGHTVDVVHILGFRSKLNYLKGAVEVLERTRRTAYDIVHAHYGLSAFPACFRVRPPLVITLHGSDVLGGGLESFLIRVIWRFADSVIVVSEEMRRRIPGIVIPCGVDLNVFRPYDRAEARSRLGWPPHKYVVLFPFDPARLVKRYDLAKAAVEQVTQTGLDVELVAICDVENREMPWYYSAADAMILCSDREGSPTAVKEALACNLPVVATDVGDVREILRGIEGSRISKQEISDLGRNLREVLHASRNGSFEARAEMMRYDQRYTIRKILSVYKHVLRARERKQSA